VAGKLPWFKFYADKWISDERLGACSIGAQGLWIRLLCLMHKNSRRGFLQQENGQPLSYAQLARLTGCATDEVAHLLRELISAGAASVSSSGVVFSRLMEREENKRRLCSEAGKKGGGSPTFKGQPKGDSKGRANLTSSLLGLSSEKDGGGGEGKTAPAAEAAGHTAAGLAETWCFLCRRKTNTGMPADLLPKVEAEFEEILRLGHSPENVLAALETKKRSRGEFLWEFKERNGFDKPAPGNGRLGSEEIAANVIASRQRALEEQQRAKPPPGKSP
jgi:hypothetical protein